MLSGKIRQLKPFTIVMFKRKIKSVVSTDYLYFIHLWKEIKNIIQEVNVTATL